MHDYGIGAFLDGDYERVVRAVAAVCGDRQRAEDAVQDALIDVWEKRRGVDDLTGWVTTAALNRSRSRWRTIAAERRAFVRLARRTVSSGDDRGAGLVDARLAKALRSLPRGQRTTVALHYMLDMPIVEIADRLGVTEGTVKTHLHRGRAALRAALVDRINHQEATHA